MPLFSRDQLDDAVQQFYTREDTEFNGAIVEWLQQHPKAREFFEGKLNTSLMAIVKHETVKAVRARRVVVSITVPIRGIAGKIWNDLDEPRRRTLSTEQLTAILELLLEEAHYLVEDGLLTYNYTVKGIYEGSEMDGELADLESEIDGELGDDGVHEEPLEALQVGTHYGDTVAVRRIDTIEGNTVHYTTFISPEGEDVEEPGTCSVKAFMHWAVEVVEVTPPESAATSPTA